MTRILILVAVLLASHAQAQIPVTDGLSLAESIKSGVDTGLEAINGAKRLDELRNQYARQLEILDSMRGEYEIGDLLNGSKYRRARRAIRELWDNNEELFGMADETAIKLGIKEPQAAVIDDNLKKKEAAAELMEQSGNLLEETEALASKIDDSPNLKAAQDLGNRLEVQGQFVDLKVLEALALLVDGLADQNLERERERIAASAMAK